MKIKRLLPVTLVLALGILSSCSKDMDEVSPGLDSTASVDAKPVNPGPQQSTLSITFNPTPVEVNETAVVTASIAPKPGEGEMWLQKGVDGIGNHTTAALAVDWVTVAKVDVSTSANVSYDFKSNSVGMYGFRAKYVPKGGSGFLAKDVKGDIQVIQSCSGVTLNGAVVSATNSGNMYTFTVAYTVNSCIDLFEAKLQGGLTAGVIFNEAIGTSPLATEVKVTGKPDGKNGDKPNYVINWALGNITKGFNNTYYITFTKELKGAGVHELTGDWSIEGKDAAKNEIKVEFPELSHTIY